MNKFDSIMLDLDEWVEVHGNGFYFEPYPTKEINCFEEPGYLHEEPGIQQVRDEIQKFISILLSENVKSILEIGLGQYGSTHFAWRRFLNRVITIEKSFDRIRDFGRRLKDYHGGDWVLDDGISWFFNGMSNDSKVVLDAYNHKHKYGPVDVLFIDGNHSEDAVLSDWLLYSPMVATGGIVAFHDTANQRFSGARKVLTRICDGEIDGKKRKVNDIIHSSVCGISYYYTI